MTKDTTFDLAFKLHTLGFSVIPSGGGDKGKAPLVEWKEYQERQPTEHELHDWQKTLHPRLWGIVTGKRARCVVVDTDSIEARQLMEEQGLKPHVITPRGGAHFYFQHHDHAVKTAAGVLPGLDIRGDGGVVNVAGKSRDGEYQIMEIPSPDTFHPWDRLPVEILEALNGAKQAIPPTTGEGLPIPEGQRNATLTSMAGTMRRCGMSQSAIEAALLETNQTQCQPLLSEDEVKGIAKSATRWEPASETSRSNFSDNEAVHLRCIADVQAEDVVWLWHPYIPKGKLTLLEGDPGIGKSWLSLAIATAISLGKGLPGVNIEEPSRVLIASAEDGLGDTIRPRLDAMGANVQNIHAIDGALSLDGNGFVLLERHLGRVRPALLIIDPLVAYLGAGVDIHRANEARAVMSQLARLAEKFDAAIIAVRHLTKGGMSKAIYRGIGSIDFTAACRSVLLAGCDSENPQNRALVPIKSNLAPFGPSIGYELRDGGFYWTGESSLTADRILAAESGENNSPLNGALSFLKNELADGALPAKDVYRDAEGIGISKRTLARAKAQLGIVSQQSHEGGKRGGGGWVWSLPDLHCQGNPPTGENQSYGDLDCQDCQYKEFGNLNHIEAEKEVATEGVGNLNLEIALGMPVEKALEIWSSEVAPVIHLGPGENCVDLQKLFDRPDIKPSHLKAVADWLRDLTPDACELSL